MIGLILHDLLNQSLEAPERKPRLHRRQLQQGDLQIFQLCLDRYLLPIMVEQLLDPDECPGLRLVGNAQPHPAELVGKLDVVRLKDPNAQCTQLQCQVTCHGVNCLSRGINEKQKFQSPFLGDGLHHVYAASAASHTAINGVGDQFTGDIVNTR